MTNQNKPNERIVLTTDDLDVEPPMEVVPYLPQRQSAKPLDPQTRCSVVFWSRSLRDYLLVGLLAGVAAWFFGDLFHGFDDNLRRTAVFSLYIDVGIWTAIIGGVISGAIGSLEGISSGSGQKAIKGAVIGAGIGVCGGFVGGLIGQWFYGTLGGGYRRSDMALQVLARTVGWTAVGLSIGFAQAIPSRQKRKIVNGLLGGLIGGAMGGICFDAIAGLASSATISRLFGITVMGIAVSIAISFVDSIRKEAWLEVVEGPLTGKQFIVYSERTKIGRAHTCEITIGKDPNLMMEHCLIHQKGNRYEIEAFPSANVRVNDYVIAQSLLYNGDIISLGETTLIFREKAVDGS